MANTKYTNQIQVDSSYDPTVSPTLVVEGDSQTVANSKMQAQLIQLGSGAYMGSWDAETNTPTLSNSTIETAGNWYNVTKAGTVDFGDGDIEFTVGDVVYSTGVVYAKRDGSSTDISLPEGELLIGQTTGLAAAKAITGVISIDKDGVASNNFTASLTPATFDPELYGNGVQVFNTDFSINIADLVIGRSYTLYNKATSIKTITFTGTTVVLIGGDALTNKTDKTQEVNPETGYTITKQNATTVFID